MEAIDGLLCGPNFACQHSYDEPCHLPTHCPTRRINWVLGPLNDLMDKIASKLGNWASLSWSSLFDIKVPSVSIFDDAWMALLDDMRALEDLFSFEGLPQFPDYSTNLVPRCDRTRSTSICRIHV